jgi:hypothetical protein
MLEIKVARGTLQCTSARGQDTEPQMLQSCGWEYQRHLTSVLLPTLTSHVLSNPLPAVRARDLFSIFRVVLKTDCLFGSMRTR